jgi:antitoxin FitA
MAQLIVRGVEEEVKARLRRRAKKHGCSMEEEVRDILRNSVTEEETAAGGLGSEIAALFRNKGLTEDIPELHGHDGKPAKFDR